MGVDQSWVSVIKGLVLLAAVAFDLISKSNDRSQILPAFMRRSKKRTEEDTVTQLEEPNNPQLTQ